MIARAMWKFGYRLGWRHLQEQARGVVVLAPPVGRAGRTFRAGYLDALYYALVEVETEVLDAHLHDDEARKRELRDLVITLRPCSFVPWWAWWLRPYARLIVAQAGIEA